MHEFCWKQALISGSLPHLVWVSTALEPPREKPTWVTGHMHSLWQGHCRSLWTRSLLADAWCLKASGGVLALTVDEGPHPPGHHTRGKGLSDTEAVRVTVHTHWLHVPSRPQAATSHKWPGDFLGHGVSSHTNYDTIPDSAQEFVFIPFSHSDT